MAGRASTGPPVRAGAGWLALREPADAAARSVPLVGELRRALPGTEPLEVRDLGCGTGSMLRWLAPLLPGPQRWVLFDRDEELLARAAAGEQVSAADGSPVAVETRARDVTRLAPDELAGASLVTASALLDMLTGEELDRMVDGCAAAGCPVLVTLSVVGRVELSPADPLDREVAAAFDAHQRRTTPGGMLLGPDAARAAAAAFRARGHEVRERPSPWRLGPADRALTAQWFSGWLSAACEQRPALRERTAAYADRRRAEAASGRLSVTVHHADLLALPVPTT
jgi:hypothetical protein